MYKQERNGHDVQIHEDTEAARTSTFTYIRGNGNDFQLSILDAIKLVCFHFLHLIINISNFGQKVELKFASILNLKLIIFVNCFSMYIRFVLISIISLSKFQKP